MPAKNPFPPTSERTNTYTPATDKFVRAGISDHNSLTLQRFAALRSCHVGRAWHLQFSLQAACQADPACADGRLPSDDASALMIGGPIHDLGDANEVLRDALDAGLVARRHGHLHLVGFKRRYPVPQAHARAPAARANRDRDANRLRANAYQRDYVVRRKAKLAEIRAAERMPLAPPQQPLRQVWPVPPSRAHQPVHLSKASSPPHFDPAPTPTEQAISAITRHQKARLGTSPSGTPQLPDPSHVHLTLISAPPTDALCSTSGGDSGHLPCLKSLGSLPSSNKLHNPPPTPPTAAPAEHQGGKHVCQEQGKVGRSPQIAARSCPADDGHCSEGQSSAPAGSEPDSPQQPVMPPSAPPTPSQSSTMVPAVFAKAMAALFACPAVTQAMVDDFKAQLGADWALVEQLLGSDVPHELNKMGDNDKRAGLVMLVRKQQHVVHKARVTAPVPPAKGEDLLAAMGIHKPDGVTQRPCGLPAPACTADVPGEPETGPQPPPAADSEPSRDSVPAIIKRVVGAKAGEVYAGPDLIRRVVALNIGPERVELAFKAAAQRPPAKFSSLGWAALTRLERLAGLKPPLGEADGADGGD